MDVLTTADIKILTVIEDQCQFLLDKISIKDFCQNVLKILRDRKR